MKRFLDGLIGLAVLGSMAGLAWLVLPARYSYALEYDTVPKDVFIKQQPHDCDFLTAPMGSKNCHYKKEVETVKWHPDPNRVYFKSKVEGPNHSDAFASIPGEEVTDTHTKVYVSWIKEDNQ